MDEITNQEVVAYRGLAEQRLIVISPFAGEVVKAEAWRVIDSLLDTIIEINKVTDGNARI